MADSNYILFINLLFLALIIMVACILIDKLRMFITNPIDRLILKINWDGYTNKLVTKIDNWIGWKNIEFNMKQLCKNNLGGGKNRAKIE